MLTPLHIIFDIFALIAVFSALGVILTRNPVHSVLSLVVTFFAVSGTWMMLHAEFLSLILLLVYVGAVMTLFLFVVMMLNIDRAAKIGGFIRFLPLGILLMVITTGLIIFAVGPEYFGLSSMPIPKPMPADYSNTRGLGEVLFTDYIYPFEIAGVILLAAIIAAITLAYKGPTRRKVQHPSHQVKVRPEDRLHLINMPSESKQKGT